MGGKELVHPSEHDAEETVMAAAGMLFPICRKLLAPRHNMGSIMGMRVRYAREGTGFLYT